jgi:hypothetical protein
MHHNIAILRVGILHQSPLDCLIRPFLPTAARFGQRRFLSNLNGVYKQANSGLFFARSALTENTSGKKRKSGSLATLI